MDLKVISQNFRLISKISNIKATTQKSKKNINKQKSQEYYF